MRLFDEVDYLGCGRVHRVDLDQQPGEWIRLMRMERSSPCDGGALAKAKRQYGEAIRLGEPRAFNSKSLNLKCLL